MRVPNIDEIRENKRERASDFTVLREATLILD